MIIRDTCDTILAPPVSARAGMFVREVTPGVAIGRVVLANGCLESALMAGMV